MQTTKIKDKKEEDAYTVEFTGSAVTQLEDLKKYLKVKNWVDVVGYGIGVVQKMKELEEAKMKNQQRFYVN